MTGDAVLLRRHGSEVVEVPLYGGAAGAGFDDLTPWRVFRSRRGQTHYSGRYWLAVAGGHVGYESLLELAWLLLNDRDQRWRQLVSQPFQLVRTIEGRRRRHVPDFLAVRDDGLVTVVDVKPRHRLENPTVAFTFAWTRDLVEAQGWTFEVFSEPDRAVLANVRFLAGYRRAWQFDAELLEQVIVVLSTPLAFAEAERQLVAAGAGRAKVRGHLLHLLWSGRVRADLTSPLHESMLLEAS